MRGRFDRGDDAGRRSGLTAGEQHQAYGQLDGVLATDDADPAAACKPFDRDRTGMVLGEGGAILIMETEQHAKARGARVLARVRTSTLGGLRRQLR